MLTKIYDNSPVFVQNMMVSAYGAKLYYERYFRRDREYMEKLMVSQWFSRDRLISLQRDKLQVLLKYAGASVPYYRQLFADISLNADDVKGVEDLGKFPLLQKETVRTMASDLVSSTLPTSNLVPLNTSGTTGKSLKVYVDIPSRRACYCFTSRFHQWAGLPDSRHNVTFGGRAIVPRTQNKNIFWRYNAAMDNYLFSSYHISDESLPFILEKLRRIRPRFIEGYPSAAFLLARYILENKIEIDSPKAIITSGETLLENQREMIEKAFSCAVFDQYGCTEQALFVSQCERGSYHVHPEFGIVEILDENGRQQERGKVGRVVCTSFMNRAMPLIRYDLGDSAAWGKEKCDCGRSFPVIEKIYGRQEDFIKTPRGDLVGRLDPIFKGLDSIKLAQIIQTKLHEITVKIVPGKNYSKADGVVVKQELQKRVGQEMEIELKIVDEIKITNNGKFKAVISKI